MNRLPIQYRNEFQDNRFLPFLAGVALAAPLFLAAGRPNYCPHCVVPIPAYPFPPQPFPPFPPQPFPPYPYPTPYPTPYSSPTATATSNIDFNTTIYGPGFQGGPGVPYGSQGYPGGVGAPFGNQGFPGGAPFGTPTFSATAGAGFGSNMRSDYFNY
ncbi:MAG: hypothetical protein K0Q49_1806 [Haloplasmataceae bacterium]|jgi:hypothetical protein|nr:hypothetical protein [Haloplasmataceae bacterium]